MWKSSHAFGEYRVKVCGDCGLGCLEGMLPEPEVLYRLGYFASNDCACGYAAYAELEPALRRTMGARLARIGRYMAERGRLLDVGCGLGGGLAVAEERGWVAEGLEVAAETVAWLRERGYRVHCGRIEQFAEREAYDCITMWDTLEHVTDPAAAVEACAGALRPGGILALTTGDRGSVCARVSGRRWHLYNIPEHRFFFTRAALLALLARARLKVLQVRHVGSWYPLNYLSERLERKYHIRVGVPKAWRRYQLYVNLYDIIELHARKAG
ncbi:MAG: class I SAM-dependent methyltransferase [bacterium]|nr:class I SAM-dependent methyltransferase [bacterium]